MLISVSPLNSFLEAFSHLSLSGEVMTSQNDCGAFWNIFIHAELVMSRGIPTGVQSLTCTPTHDNPYPSEGYRFVKGTGKPMGDLQVYIQKLTIGIELIYRIHIYTTADTLQKLNNCKSCSPTLVCVCPPSFMFTCPCSCWCSPTTIVLLL